jgi:maltose-binding protein MalE
MRAKARVAAVLGVICLGAGMYYIGDKTITTPEEGNLITNDTQAQPEQNGSGKTLDSVSESGSSTGLVDLFHDKETIYFWYADEELTDYFTNAAVSFGTENDIRVIPQLVEQSEFLEEVNEASLYGDQVPDLYLTTHDTLEKAYLAGLAAEVKSDCVDADHFPISALSAVSYHDKLVAYPLFFDTSVLLYNETYLQLWARQQAEREAAEVTEGEAGSEEAMSLDEEAVVAKAAQYLETAVPKTVDDILNIADTFDAQEGIEGVMKWDVSDIFYNYWFVGNYMTVGGNTGDEGDNLQINNTESAQCLEVYKSLNQFFSIESSTVNYDSVLQDFFDGKIVFTIATADAAKRLEEEKQGENQPYELKAAVIPDVSPTLQSRSMSVTNVVAVNGYSAHKDAANAFAAYLTTEYAKELYDRTGKIPAMLHANQEDTVLATYAEEYAASAPLPKMMAAGNYWMSLEVLFSKVWNGGDVPALLDELGMRMQDQMAGTARVTST